MLEDGLLVFRGADLQIFLDHIIPKFVPDQQGEVYNQFLEYLIPQCFVAAFQCVLDGARSVLILRPLGDRLHIVEDILLGRVHGHITDLRHRYALVTLVVCVLLFVLEAQSA